MARPFVHSLRVRFGECDPQGVVFNPNYLAYFDHTLTELWREAVGGWDTMVARGVDAVVGEANIRFRAAPDRPAREPENELLEEEQGQGQARRFQERGLDDWFRRR